MISTFTMSSIHPVSDFSRKPAKYIQRLKKTGKPEILTVNGCAEVVIQDAKSYEKMVNLLNSLEKISRSVKEHDQGKAVSMEEFSSKFEKNHGLKRDECMK
jgi:prevent-host-death family protein